MNEPDFQVTNKVGTVLFTTNDRDIAKSKARELADTFPDVRVEEVMVITQRRTIYRPRLNLVRAA